MLPRLAVYGIASTLFAGGVVSSALHSRANFYAAAVAVGRSSGALMVLANFALFNAICLGIALKKVFFGQLRAIEYEHLFERLWMFLTESLLALTIFRDDFSAPFAFMYGLLLFLKCFHWITADRVDYMDQIPPPGPPPLFHLRITLIILLLTIFDLLLVTYSLETILIDGVSAMVLFASEFTILLASISGTALRYAVNLVDLRRARGRADAPSWEEKSMWLFYVDLGVDFVKLLTYLSFFTVILLHYGLPLHILRDVYMTLRSFLTRCGDLIRYRRATRDMDALYPDATPEELERSGDRTCIICREEMIPRGAQPQAQGEMPDEGADGAAGGPNETPKKLACGHIFHFHCLRSWLERQQSCPTCRRDVLRTPAAARATRNPPPPAPGAIPQPPNGNANLDPQGIMRQGFEDYFRIPQLPRNNATPTPAPATAADAAGGAIGAGDVGSNGLPAHHGSEEDRTIQRGIWGGQVVPGRFFPAPLGAAPRLPPGFGPARNASRVASTRTGSTGSAAASGTTQPTAGSSTESTGLVPPPAQTSSTPQTRSQPENTSSTTPSGTTTTPTITQNSALSTPQLASGSTTPFSSQAPVIFSSTGEMRIASLSEQPEGDNGAVGDARRAAAEAAMRRLGLGVTPSMVINSEGTEGGAAQRGVVVDEKGKGKAASGAERSSDEWDAQPKQVPYLTISQDELSAPVQRRMEGVGLTELSEINTEAGAAQGLEERLRVLREVDEVL